MSVRSLDKLFKPRAVALIGTTPRHGSLGAGLARNLRRGGFGAPLMLVNRHQRSIGAMPVYSSIASLPEVPDLAVIATPPETVPGAIAGLGAQGTRAAPQRAIGGWEPIRRN
jgi:acetyltransferase